MTVGASWIFSLRRCEDKLLIFHVQALKDALLLPDFNSFSNKLLASITAGS